jgi:hypothetical protein
MTMHDFPPTASCRLGPHIYFLVIIMTKCQCKSAGHDHKPGECQNQGLLEKENLCDSCYYLVLNERAPGWQSTSWDEVHYRPRTWRDNSWWMRRDQDKPPKAPSLPEEHPFYSLVGRVTSEWSHIEHILDTTIWNLLDIDHVFAACVTSQVMGIGPRCKTIITLIAARNISDKLIKPYRSFMGDSDAPADWRNRFVHDPWITETTEGAKQFRAMPYVDPRFGEQEIDRQELQKLLATIKGLQTRASDLHEKVVAALAHRHRRARDSSAPPAYHRRVACKRSGTACRPPTGVQQRPSAGAAVGVSGGCLVVASPSWCFG